MFHSDGKPSVWLTEAKRLKAKPARLAFCSYASILGQINSDVYLPSGNEAKTAVE